MATEADSTRRQTTVLFGDIVGSTALAASLGDRGWASFLEEHQRRVAEQIVRWHGEEMDTAGDGFFAIFGRPCDAVSCAFAVREQGTDEAIELRFGVHTGSCWAAGSKCTGLDVHVGARIAAAAAPGQILLSGAAAGLLAGDPRFRLESRGHVRLRGVPEPHALYAVSARVAAASHAEIRST